MLYYFCDYCCWFGGGLFEGNEYQWYLVFEFVFDVDYGCFGDQWMVGDVFFDFVCVQVVFGYVDYIVGVVQDEGVVVFVVDCLVQ